MHLIRRSALRAISSPSTSFVSQSSAIKTSSPFALQSKVQSYVPTSVFRRFKSDDSVSKNVDSADGESSSVRQALNSAAETASTYASEAAETVKDYSSRAAEEVSETATGAATAFGAGRDRRSFGGRPGGAQFGRHQEPSPSKNIYVGNLIFDITKDDLAREFNQFGTIKNVTIATDARGLSKGFGYVEFETIEQAAAAIEAKHQTILDGRRLAVNYQVNVQRQYRNNPPSKTLFVGNLAFEMSDADLNKLFRDIKNVIDVRVAIDRRTGQPRGFAHADFTDIESATKGKEALVGKEIYGRALRVDFSAGPQRPAYEAESSL